MSDERIEELLQEIRERQSEILRLRSKEERKPHIPGTGGVSASEKLRALAREAAGIEAATVPVNPSDLGYVQYNEPEERLMDALPLLADVVEAAEKAEKIEATSSYASIYSAPSEMAHDIRVALAALDEHLGERS